MRAIAKRLQIDRRMLLALAATGAVLAAWARPVPAGEACPWLDWVHNTHGAPASNEAVVLQPAILRFLDDRASRPVASAGGADAWSRLPPGRDLGSPGTRL
jgi:hypothetical protein